jgi:hypothetical protein
MIELSVKTEIQNLNIVYFNTEMNYPEALEKLNSVKCRMPSMKELRIIFEFSLDNPDTGITVTKSIWSSDSVEVRGRNDQFVKTKSFYDGKNGGDAGFEGIQPHINQSVKLFVIGVRTYE